ncbi:MAG TPA: metallophosphoesterase [Treponema sp.]|nr:metallophosphoesterase [Treponema sp.]
MKILCVSDQIDPLIYNQNAVKSFPDIDVILCAGDLPMDYVDFIVSTFNKPTYFIFGNHNLTEYRYYHKGRTPPVAQYQYVSPAASMTGGHGAFYAGFRVIRNRNLSFKDPATGKITPLLIAGVSGSIRYNNGLNQYTDRQMKSCLLHMMPALIYNKIRYGRYLDILLTHASPRHVHDQEDPCHKGFESFNWFINKFQPSYLVHGHIHLYDMRTERITKVNKTTVVNAYAHCVLEFPQENAE